MLSTNVLNAVAWGRAANRADDVLRGDVALLLTRHYINRNGIDVNFLFFFLDKIQFFKFSKIIH